MNGPLGYPITCEVCPHHLFFTEEDVETKLGDKKGQVRPCLSTKEDREFLLENLEYIDTIGSDHAPHTVEEKTGKNGKSIILDISNTPSIPEIIWVRNVRAIVVCGFLKKS